MRVRSVSVGLVILAGVGCSAGGATPGDSTGGSAPTGGQTSSGGSVSSTGGNSSATGGATITTYSFNWGDGSPIETGSAQVRQHNFGLTTGAGTYTVRLTVTDSLGRTGSVTQSVTVP